MPLDPAIAAAPRPAPAGAATPVLVNARAGGGCDEAWAQKLESLFRDEGMLADVKLLHDGAQLEGALRDALA
ncbi:MAG TPA: hypothetical protein VFL14_03995, partial [Xanthomonadales bacterium]|nr:hypothetical protein [Xanthomonadales bacterium]